MLICWDQCFLQKHTGFDWTFHGCYFPRSGHNFQPKSEINLRRAETKGFRLPRGFCNHRADLFPECKQKQNSCKRRDHETLAQEEWVMQGTPLDVLEPQVLIWSWFLHSGKLDLCSLNLLGFWFGFFFYSWFATLSFILLPTKLWKTLVIQTELRGLGGWLKNAWKIWFGYFLALALMEASRVQGRRLQTTTSTFAYASTFLITKRNYCLPTETAGILAHNE